jgi:hypothetical protein
MKNFVTIALAVFIGTGASAAAFVAYSEYQAEVASNAQWEKDNIRRANEMAIERQIIKIKMDALERSRKGGE